MTEPNFPDDAGRPRRVLIVRIGAMGDVLHAMPAVAALRARHPAWFIGWAVEPGWSALLRAEGAVEARGAGMPLVDRVHLVPTRAWKRRPFALSTAREIGALRQELRGEQYDLCVDMQGAIRSAVIGGFAGAGEFVGPTEPRERPARWLYGKQVRTAAAHVVDQGCEILGAAVGEALMAAEVALPVDEAAERWRDELLARVLPGGAGARFVVIAPSAGWGAKQWPAERYGAVAAELGRAGYTTLVNAACAEDALANAVAKAGGGAAIVVACGVGELVALLRRASLVIAGDTGPLHLAAALGRPVVGLYGPTDPARNGPYGTRSRVLRHGSSRRDHSRHAETEAGLMQITVDEVAAAALELLRGEQDKVVL
jgi:heptosyltransferase-1